MRSPPWLTHTAEFLALLEQALPSRRVALIALHLSRSDRIAALLSAEYAQTVQIQLKERIQSALRSEDRGVFVSENECWLLLPELPSPALAVLAVHRLFAALQKPLNHNGHEIYVHPYAGVVCEAFSNARASDWLRMAESAQKQAQRDPQRFVLAQPQVSASALTEQLPKLIGEALAANALEVAYQPKVDLHTQRMVSVEALVRWPREHPQQISIPAMIACAENCGLIEALTLNVLNVVLRETMSWPALGLDTRVWVNVSASLLGQPQLPRTLAHALDVWSVPPERIGIEITENALIHDLDQSTELLHALRDLGFHLAIDDFGTGYSSLSYLRRFPIDELKIDRVFIANMCHSEQDRQIVQSIIALTHFFGLKVVAEGAEDEATMRALLELGCDQIQGYYYARPMPAQQLLSWVEQFHRRNAVSNTSGTTPNAL